MTGDMRHLDEDRPDTERQATRDALRHERELLGLNPESVRSFYSLTGTSRKNYVEQIAEAEANRVKALGAARAENIRAAATAAAQAIRDIGTALAEVRDPVHVLEYLKIQAAERIAQSLASGRATKIVVPESVAGIMSVLATVGGRPGTGASNVSHPDLPPPTPISNKTTGDRGAA